MAALANMLRSNIPMDVCMCLQKTIYSNTDIYCYYRYICGYFSILFTLDRCCRTQGHGRVNPHVFDEIEFNVVVWDMAPLYKQF